MTGFGSQGMNFEESGYGKSGQWESYELVRDVITSFSLSDFEVAQ
jgi:hypothetical protein